MLRALGRTDRDLQRTVKDGLVEAAGPVARDAQDRLSKYVGVGPIVPAARISGVVIQQKARKKTGKRPDFGSLQMTRGLIPAAEHGEAEFVGRVDEALGRLIAREGLS